MTFVNLLLSGLVAVLCGLDRTAVLQLMLSRPIVAGPLTGLVLGSPLTGLQVGMLVELLWLGRLPVGASIPPDDTQIAVGGTFLAVAFSSPDFTAPVTIVFVSWWQSLWQNPVSFLMKWRVEQTVIWLKVLNEMF